MFSFQCHSQQQLSEQVKCAVCQCRAIRKLCFCVSWGGGCRSLLLGGRGQPRPSPFCPRPCLPLAVWKLACVLRPLTVRSGPRAKAATSTALFSFTMLLMTRRNSSPFPESSPFQRSVVTARASGIRPVGTELHVASHCQPPPQLSKDVYFFYD